MQGSRAYEGLNLKGTELKPMAAAVNYICSLIGEGLIPAGDKYNSNEAALLLALPTGGRYRSPLSKELTFGGRSMVVTKIRPPPLAQPAGYRHI